MTILDLPTELLPQITSYLRYPFHLALSMTCRALHFTLPNPNIPSSPRNTTSPPSQTEPTHSHHSSSESATKPKMYDIYDLLAIEL